MQARTLLAIVATLQLLTICLNFTLASYVIWLTLPFAALAFFGVFLAIYCGWRTGIWVFMGECRRGVGGQGSPGEIRRGGGAAGAGHGNCKRRCVKFRSWTRRCCIIGGYE